MGTKLRADCNFYKCVERRGLKGNVVGADIEMVGAREFTFIDSRRYEQRISSRCAQVHSEIPQCEVALRMSHFKMRSCLGSNVISFEP